MANVACWYQTQLPTNMIDNLIEDLESLKPDDFLIKSKVVANENEQEGEIKENLSLIHI